MGSQIDVGAVIRKVFRIYVDQASVLMPAAAVVFVITGIVTELMIAASAGLGLVAVIIDLVAGFLFTGMVVSWSPTFRTDAATRARPSCCAL